MIAKSDANPLFQAARAGAEAAARDLSDLNGLQIEIAWLTPAQEDAEVQAQRIAQAVNEGAHAVIIACSDPATVTAAINDAVGRGVPVMTFDSDAPQSRRFAFHGVDDVKLGEMVLAELSGLIGGKGKVAVLAGNRRAPNLARRIDGVKLELSQHPGIELVGPFFHAETPQDAAAEVLRVQSEQPDIVGWAMVGGWPLFSRTLLSKLDPARVKIVAVGALPAQLAYVESGLAPVLLAPPAYNWGHTSVETVIAKLHYKRELPAYIPLAVTRVSRDNLTLWRKQLAGWGFVETAPPGEAGEKTPDKQPSR